MNDMTEEKSQGAAPANENSDENSAGELLQKTFRLMAPIHSGDTTITHVTVTEPLARQQTMAEREQKVHGHIFTSLMLQISDLPKKALEELKLRDIGQIKRWLNDINAKALKEDGLSLPEASGRQAGDDPFADEAADIDFDDLPDSERTFRLSVPVSYDGRTISEIKLVEPGLKAATAATKFNEDTAQTTAIVAVMANETVPVISRIAYRDLHRMEVWMIPFVENLQSVAAG